MGEVAPLWSLIPLSLALGPVFVLTLAKLSNRRALDETKRRLSAHLYELRLFVDEPRLILRAQTDLLRHNLRYIALMVVPAAAIALPGLFLYGQLDAVYGWAPLRPGEPAIVTAQLKQSSGAAPVLRVPEGFVVETPAVRAAALGQVSWRVRPVRPASGMVQVTVAGETVHKSISSEQRLQRLSRRRVSAWSDLAWDCAEWPLSSPIIDWVEVDYPAARIEFSGVELHWAVCAAVLSLLSGLLWSRRKS